MGGPWLPCAAVMLVGALLGRASAQEIERAIAAAERLGARTGVAALELDGTVRHRHRPSESFVPASNLKLLSAAAVLHGLGRDFAFTTRCELRAGTLVVHAGGDPNWIEGTAHAADALWQGLVAALQRHGVGAVRAVECDAGAFTGPGRPSTWPQDQLDTYYCAPTGGLVLEQGTFLLRLRPDGGTAVATLLAPVLPMPIEGSITVVADQRSATYGAIDRGMAIRVQGRMWHKAKPAEIRVAMRDPQPWFERAVAAALHHGGVAVTDAAPSRDVADLYLHRTPLQPALQRMLEDSSNFDAEQCARVLGATALHDGTLQGGVRALAQALQQLLGTSAEGLQQVDASGLSRDNRVTPDLLVRALRAVAASPDSELFFAALPLAGRTGTLAERFVRSPLDGRVRAKTGWIRGASALSGLLTRRDGSRCAFAILMNYDPSAAGLNKQLKELQERIVEALDDASAGRG